MNTRIDLESAIMTAWQTADDIDLLFKHYGDHPTPMTEDDVLNALLGIKVLHEMRMEKLMDTYCQKFELDKYCTDPEKLAARERLMNPDFPVKQPKKGSKK